MELWRCQSKVWKASGTHIELASLTNSSGALIIRKQRARVAVSILLFLSTLAGIAYKACIPNLKDFHVSP
jgi:hypothetical protein